MTDATGAFLFILIFVTATILISRSVSTPNPQYVESKVVKTFLIDPENEYERQQGEEE